MIAETTPELSPDGLELYFGRSAGGSVDIFLSARASRDDPFGLPMPVAELATAAWEAAPSADPNRLIFARSRTNWSGRQLFLATRSVAAPAGASTSS